MPIFSQLFGYFHNQHFFTWLLFL